MIKRCIMIFPEFENIKKIDEIRSKYDPLANHVRPHITLVFPFDSNIETIELKNHISSVLKDFNSFNLTLNEIKPVRDFGKYLFLNIQNGKKEIIKMHEKLNTGILVSYYPSWLKSNTFLPHMTVGRFEDEEKFEKAIEDTKNIDDYFGCVVNKVSVEIIDENEDSTIEFHVNLNKLFD